MNVIKYPHNVHLIIKMVAYHYNLVIYTSMNNVISIIWELLRILKDLYYHMESVFGTKWHHYVEMKSVLI